MYNKYITQQKGAFFNEINNEDKLKMCEEHIKNGKSLSRVSEMYGGYYVSNIKYLVNLYRKHGKNIFYRDGETIYRKDTKLLAIGRVKSGESIISVALI